MALSQSLSARRARHSHMPHALAVPVQPARRRLPRRPVGGAGWLGSAFRFGFLAQLAMSRRNHGAVVDGTPYRVKLKRGVDKIWRTVAYDNVSRAAATRRVHAGRGRLASPAAVATTAMSILTVATPRTPASSRQGAVTPFEERVVYRPSAAAVTETETGPQAVFAAGDKVYAKGLDPLRRGWRVATVERRLKVALGHFFLFND